MKKPFVYGELAEDENFIDRIEDRKRLKTFLSSGINVTLISPRRWGKSSLVKKSTQEMVAENSNTKVCYIDAFRLNSANDFYSAYTTAVANCVATTMERITDSIKRHIRSFSPSLNIKGRIVDVEINLNYHPTEKTVEEILDLPEQLAKEHNYHIIVCIDEFQRLAELPEWKSMEGMLRSVWQHHKNVNYCLYGSKRHMMTQIFTNSNNPFYRFGQTLYLEKIAPQYWIEYIINTFKETGKYISEDFARLICHAADNHSWYVQQLSFFVWAATEDSVTEDIFRSQLQAVIDTNKPVFESEVDKLATSQIAMLRAIAAGENHLNAADVVKKYNLGGAQTITRNKRLLIEKDFLEKHNDTIHFVDPIFKLWFERQYLQ